LKLFLTIIFALFKNWRWNSNGLEKYFRLVSSLSQFKL
jgi:hypothetical protein